MLTQLLTLVLNSATAAHLHHLGTRSDAEHRSLAEFYDDVRGAVDSLAEVLIAMGQDVVHEADTLERLKSEYREIQGMRDELCDGDPTALNLLDNVGAVYLKAIYRLERLK
jgi:DNA-binding ferritin-like protein